MTQFNWSDPPSQTAFPVAKAGYPFIFASAFATAVFALLGMALLALLGLLITGFICYFFRDPDRLIPTDQGIVVSPADGKVSVTPAQLAMLLEGIDWRAPRRTWRPLTTG